jgi:hypothetical protein
VLTAQGHLYDARNEVADALTDYAIATLNSYRDVEIFQVCPDGLRQEGPNIPASSIQTTANTSMAAR